MTENLVLPTLFSLPLALERGEAQPLAEDLTALWQRQTGSLPGSLHDDLRSPILADIFSPLKAGKTLRAFLDALADQPPCQSGPLLRPPLVVGTARDVLVTVEGRVCLEIVRTLLSRDMSDPIVITGDSIRRAEHLVYERYRDWSMRRLEDVIKLRSGQAAVIGPPGIAFLLFLLVNRSFSPKTAIKTLPKRKVDQERLDQAAGRIIEAYSDVINPSVPGHRNPRHFSFYGGYARSEARRRLSWALGPEDDSNYIRCDKVNETTDFAATEMRRVRSPQARARLLAAFDALVDTYRRELPILGSLEMAHEDRAATADLRKRLESSLEQAENNKRS